MIIKIFISSDTSSIFALKFNNDLFLRPTAGFSWFKGGMFKKKYKN